MWISINKIMMIKSLTYWFPKAIKRISQISWKATLAIIIVIVKGLPKEEGPMEKSQFVESVCVLRKMGRRRRMDSLISWFALVNVLGQWDWFIYLAWENGLIARDLFTKVRKFNRFSGKHLSVNFAKSHLKIEWDIGCSKLWNLTYPTMITNIWF